MSVNKRIMKLCGFCLLVMALCGLWLPIRASENSIFMMKAADRTEIREAPDESSAVVLEVEKDTPLLILEDTDAEWCHVQYQGMEGYLVKASIIPYADKEELQQEFSDLEQYFQSGFSQVQRYQKKDQQDAAWKIIITLMAAGIVVLGIYALGRKKHHKEDDQCRPM